MMLIERVGCCCGRECDKQALQAGRGRGGAETGTMTRGRLHGPGCFRMLIEHGAYCFGYGQAVKGLQHKSAYAVGELNRLSPGRCSPCTK